MSLLHVLLILCLSLAFSASAHDDTEPFADFFNGLTRPNAGFEGMSCCGMHRNCENVERYELTPDGYVAYDGKQSIPVPSDRVIHKPNPTGRAVLCMAGNVVLCFVPTELY